MTPTRTPLLSLIAMLTGSVMSASASDYLSDVKPLLQRKCYACHAALKQQGGLRVDTGRGLLRGGDSGAVVTTGKPVESFLIDVLTGDAGFRMPPANEGAPLTEDEIGLIRDWISAGAEVPDDEEPETDPGAWWSYQPICRPQLPVVNSVEWCRNDIDRFVAATREEADLPHAGEASKEIWLRRVSLDLIGLPPTRAERHGFLADNSPVAHERVVDDLLNRPQYGERWGRHWMDIWRYSDWYGSRGINEIRYSQRHIWRWRDWIVNSLNSDRGYDRMVREMLAADEISSGDCNAIPATGYLGRNWYKFDRDVWLAETVERTGEAFLGLTFRCCRCHDHKFDPVTQVEYYRFRAFFEPHDVRTDPVSALTDMQQDATLGEVLTDGIALVYDKHADAPTYRFERGDSRYPDKAAPLTAGVPAALGGNVSITPVSLPPHMWYPLLRPELDESDGENILRRSLYFRNTPNEKVPLLEIFDMADPNACYHRRQSVVPHQSLAMMNSGLAIDSARHVCKRLADETDFVTAAFETVLSRRPTAEEHERCRTFLARHPQLLQQAAADTFSVGGSAKQTPAADPAVRARENLIHVLFLHNDFVTIR